MAAAEQKKSYAVVKNFTSLNTKANRTAIKEDEFAWIENAQPIGHGNIKIVPAQSTVRDSGNAAVAFGNTVTTLNNLTLANVTITSGTSNVTNVNVTSINVTNLTATLANITTLNVASEYVTASNVATAVIGNLTLSNALTVPNGGTGRVTLPVNNVLLGNGTGSIASVAQGNVGNVLTSFGGAWVSNAATSGIAGGSNGQVQYNNANVLAGSANLTFDGANLGVGVASTGGSKVYISGGSLASSPSASGIAISGNLTSGRLVTQGSGQLQAVHSFFDSSSLEISQGSTGTQTGIVINGGSATNNPSTLQFFTSLSERVRIDSSGNVTLQKNISVGGATPTTSGTGITFPATQSASSDAQTLDDYEEGIWTPAVSYSTSNGDVAYTVRYGSYTKVGRVVTCTGFVWFSETTASGNLSVSGLPFTSLGGGTYGYGWKGVVQSTDFTGYTSFFLSVVGGFGGGTTTAGVYGNAGTQLTNANTALNTVFTFSVTYEVT